MNRIKKSKQFCSSLGCMLKTGFFVNRGSYMSAHVLLILLNKLRKRDKIRGLSSILSLLQQV